MTCRYCEMGPAARSWHNLLILLLLSAGGCSSADADRAEVQRPVKTMLVTAGAETRTRTFPGKAEASQRVELGFRVGGVIVELPVREGQTVARGDLLARLRTDEFQARLTTLQGQLDQARANLRALQSGDRPEQRLRLEAQVRAAAAQLANARSEFDRSSQLVGSNVISREAFERTETTYRVAQEEYEAAVQMLEKGTIARQEDLDAQEAQVRALEGRVVEAGIQLEDATLLAPYDGVIAQRFVELNQNVTPNQPVVMFQDVEEIEVTVDVPESIMAAEIRRADIVEISAEFSGAPGIRFPAFISEVSQRADPVTQTFQVTVALQAPAEVNVLPGMTSTVTLIYRRASILGTAILVPTSAVVGSADGEQAVWLIDADNVVTRQVVQLGEPQGNQIEVLSGLQPGQRIATAGVTFLREGMKVRDLGDALGAQL